MSDIQDKKNNKLKLDNTSSASSNELSKSLEDNAVSIVLEENNSINVQNADQWIKHYSQKSTNTYLNEFYKAETEILKMVLKAAIKLLFVSCIATFIITVLCLFLVNGNSAVIAGGVGILFSGLITHIVQIYSETLKSRKTTLEMDFDNSKFDKILDLVKEANNPDNKDELIKIIVKQFFSKDKNDKNLK